MAGALARFLRERTRGTLRFSPEIEDQIDPDKKEEREAKAAGERVKRGYESQREMRDAVNKELGRKKKQETSAGWIRG